jgi:hypothetical protein
MSPTYKASSLFNRPLIVLDESKLKADEALNLRAAGFTLMPAPVSQDRDDFMLVIKRAREAGWFSDDPKATKH